MIENLIKWVAENREWIFSGIGVFALSCIFGLATWIYGRSKFAEQIPQKRQSASDHSHKQARPDSTPEEPSVHRASIEDVKRYDLKTRQLLRKIEVEETGIFDGRYTQHYDSDGTKTGYSPRNMRILGLHWAIWARKPFAALLFYISGYFTFLITIYFMIVHLK